MPNGFEAATVRPNDPATVRPVGEPRESRRGTGWIGFAGVMIAILGVLNSVYGIAAISDSRFFVRDVAYIVSDLNTYGWALLVIGVVQVCAAFGIFAAAEWARWAGILSAGVNAVVQLLFMPSYPFLSLALFAVGILVIYGLVAYGGRTRRATA
jgi:hypothetical protein